jgi:hypothetical protein
MKKITIISFVCICIAACKGNNAGEATQDINIGDRLILSVPRTTKFIKGNGVDSYVAFLVDEQKDTFRIDYGHRGIINDLHEEQPSIFLPEKKEWVTKSLGRTPTVEDALFSEYPEEDREQRIFDKNYFMYDTVNKIVAKVVQPKKIGNGITGLYFPKLKDGKSFSIYAANLDSIGHRRALEMFKTIRYK